MPAKGGRTCRSGKAASLPHRRLNASDVRVVQYSHWNLLEPSKDGLIAKLLLKEILFFLLWVLENIRRII